MRLLRHRARERGFRLFYASDVHGSDVCWKKFLNARGFYEVDALVMGGDLTGKALVPVVRGADARWSATVLDERRVIDTEDGLERLEAEIRKLGFYPWRLTEAELAELRADPVRQAEVFDEAILAEIERWMELARERTPPAALPALVMPGNDDPWSIDPILERADAICPCDGRIVRVAGRELVSLGWSNRTPWNTPRELDEDALYGRLRGLVDQLESPRTAILNIHVPPYDSGLDTAVELDEELRPVTRGGQPQQLPVGSRAVRQIIEECQPVLSLHGHIHECRGMTRIGRTLAVNPGSDYGGGRIEGCFAELNGEGVRHSQLTTG